MSTWFTSDWHFGHRNVLTLGAGRPFGTVEEMNETLIERHNAMVSPDDEVWVLGDAAMGSITESLACCARMNGHKILVCGNHDRPAMTDDPAWVAVWRDRYMGEGGFSGVLLVEPSAAVCLPGGQIVLASHYPYAGDSRDGPDRYADRRPVDFGEWLLHGHVHHRWRVNGCQINVGVDVWDYAPVSADTIKGMVVSR